MYNVKQAAELFHVSPQTLRKWIRDGELRCVRLGKVVRFSEAQIQEFVKRNEAQRAR